MALKDFFAQASERRQVINSSLDSVDKNLESKDFMEQYDLYKKRFVPEIDMSNLESFVKYGSAQKYYIDGINRILNTYPYDGSAYEKILWLNESSLFDLHLFETQFPKTNGYITLSNSGVTSSQLIGTYKLVTNSNERDHIYISSPYSSNTLLDSKRGNNLALNPLQGNTIEFWLNKENTDIDPGVREVVFDLYNGKPFGDPEYGRVRIELEKGSATNTFSFVVTYLKGANGFSEHQLPLSLTSITGWHHFSFSFYQDSDTSNLLLKFYKDGTLIETADSGVTLSAIDSESSIAAIGSLVDRPDDTVLYLSQDWRGSGKLSASIDEFRFWKLKRDSQQIFFNYFSNVDGGTNVDNSNYGLSIYYKFNEGISGDSTIDSNILDYSGRIMNATWVNYPATGTRSTSSAMVISGKADFESKDPIMTIKNPLVYNFFMEKTEEGRIFDDQNHSSFFNSLPGWITEEDRDFKEGELENLTQIISSFFDNIHFMIDGIYNTKDSSYLTLGEEGESYYRNNHHYSLILESLGFDTEEFFQNLDFFESYINRSEDKLYKDKIFNIKNSIHRNVYNNLVSIYKTKGTENSFRNLMRCVGLGDNLVSINSYANNSIVEFKDRHDLVELKKKHINFFDDGNHDALVFQEFNSIPEIDLGLLKGMTAEANVILPTISTENKNQNTFTGHSSLFGCYSPDLGGTSFNSIQDTDFQVRVVRAENKNSAKFVLSSTSLSLELESVEFDYEFNDSIWNISVKIGPKEDFYFLDGITPSIVYTLKFSGYSRVSDGIDKSFVIEQDIVKSIAEDFIRKEKKFYVGANRQDFTGSVLYKAYCNVLNFRYWTDELASEDLKAHSTDVTNFGRSKISRTTNIDGDYDNPIVNTNPNRHLILNWDFESLDIVGDVLDISSGSFWPSPTVSTQEYAANRFYPGKLESFGVGNEKIKTKKIRNFKKKLPESINSSDMTQVAEGENKFSLFYLNIDPVNYYTLVEKSPASIVSREMINLFSTVSDFDDIIGQGVNRYRGDYKLLSKIRQLFFEKVNSNIDFDKFFDFYKWYDSSLSSIVDQLLPANMQANSTINNVIESHILERSKYRNKFNFFGVKSVDPIEANLSNNRIPYVPEGQRFSPAKEYCNYLFWKTKAEKTNPTITSGDAVLDAARQNLFNPVLEGYNRKRKSFVLFDADFHSEIGGGINDGANKDIIKSSVTQGTAYIPLSSISRKQDFFEDCSFKSKYKANFEINMGSVSGSGRSISPVSLYLQKSTNEYAISPDNFENKYYTIEEGYNGIELSYNDGTKSIVYMVPGTYELLNDQTDRCILKVIQNALNTDPDIQDVTRYYYQTYYTACALDGPYYNLDVSPINVNNTLFTDYPYVEISYPDPFPGKFITEIRLLTKKNFQTETGLDTTINENFSSALCINADGTFTSVPTINFSRNRSIYYFDLSNFSTFKTKIEITGHHEDVYGPSFERPMQSPFNKIHVGCSPHRKVFVGSEDRLEALNVNYSSVFIKLNSDISRVSTNIRPEDYARRPVNIRNIRTQTNGYAGNFSKNYEVVQSSAIKKNLKWANSFEFKYDSDSFITSNPSLSTHIGGLKEFSKPDRSFGDSTIIERFSAPGGPETMGDSRGGPGLDVVTTEFSVYNSLNYRNLKVRKFLDKVGRQHSGPAGHSTFSVHTSSWYSSSPVMSYHKTNPNPRLVFKLSGSTSSVYNVYDNQFIQTPIPAQIYGYSWITASSTGEKNIEGYLINDQEIAFLLQGEDESVDLTPGHGSTILYGLSPSPTSERFFIDFVGLNTVINDPIEVHETGSNKGFPVDNLLGVREPIFPTTGYSYQGGAVLGRTQDFQVNDLILNRQGPYGWPSWKQTRTGNHRIVRYQKKNNIISVNKSTDKLVGDKLVTIEEFKQFKEPMVTIKHKPVITNFVVPVVLNDESVESQEYSIEHTFVNNKGRFANDDLNSFIYEDGQNIYNTEEIYSKLLDMYSDDNVQFKKLNYNEVIYPKEVNTFLSRTRQRNESPFSSWDEDGDKRRATASVNFVGEFVTGANGSWQSKWPIDSHGSHDTNYNSLITDITPFESSSNGGTFYIPNELTGSSVYWYTGSDGRLYYKDADGSGELQNWYTTYHGGDTDGLIDAGVLYNRKIRTIDTPEPGQIILSSSYYQYIFTHQFDKAIQPILKIRSGIGSRHQNAPQEIRFIFATASDYFSYIGNVGGFETYEQGLGLPNHVDNGPSDLINQSKMEDAYDALATYIRTDFPYLSASSNHYNDGVNYYSTITIDNYMIDNEVEILQEEGVTHTHGHTYWSITGSSNAVFSGTMPGDYLGYGIPYQRNYYYGSTKFEVSEGAGKSPFYASYEHYIEDMKRAGKDFSVVPEFRISQKINDYVNNGYNFLSDLDRIFEITGSGNSSDDQFYKDYVNSDFLKAFDIVYSDHDSKGVNLDSITLSCKAFKRFLPYEGLYPAQRSIEIARDFYNGYKDIILKKNTNSSSWTGGSTDVESDNIRPILSFMFSPGILFNSIKSGIAVDYPIYVKEMTGSMLSSNNLLNESFDKRMPFQSLFAPEEFLGESYIPDQEPDQFAALDFNLKFGGKPKSDIYNISINNFMAEIGNFFLEKPVNSIVSEPTRGVSPGSYNQYKMIVSLSKDDDLIMYDRDSAFGPPCSLYKSQNQPGITEESPSLPWNLVSNSFTASCYTPFTPAYYNGESYVEITFPKSGSLIQDKTYTISEIKANSEYSFYRNIGHESETLDTTYLGFPFTLSRSVSGLCTTDYMNISASIQYDNVVQVNELEETESWVISSIFESPVLDFSGSNPAIPSVHPGLTDAGNTPFNKSATTSEIDVKVVSQGMWHQSGSIPKNKSIKVSLKDSPDDNIGSLRKLLGFKENEFKVGEVVRQFKDIKEAVVAVPYVIGEDNKKNFFNFEKEIVNFIVKANEIGINSEEYYRIVSEGLESVANISSESLSVLRTSLPKSGVPHPSYYKVISAMQEFVFPPNFDFIKFKDKVDPLVMFVFEFTHRLSQKDVINIWQNVLPDNDDMYGPDINGENDKTSTTYSTMTHKVLAGSLFDPKPGEELRWMVFKVKQRAANSFSDVAPYTKNVKSPPEQAMGYSHNWPYDYFSVIELINIEASAEFVGNESEEVKFSGYREIEESHEHNKPLTTVQKFESAANRPLDFNLPQKNKKDQKTIGDRLSSKKERFKKK